MAWSLQAAFIVGAWVLVVLILTGGYWFLRRNQLLHTAMVMILALVAIFLLVRLRELVIMLVIAGVVAFILDGLVERLAQRLPRPLAIALVYVGLLVVVVAAGALLIPLIVHQARLFVLRLPTFTDQARRLAGHLTAWYGGTPAQIQNAIDTAIEQLQTASRSATRQVEHVLLDVLGWTVKGLLSLIISIYLLTDKDNLEEQFLRLFPADIRPEVRMTMGELSLVFSRYLRGQITVILFVATAVTLVLLAFRIPYAFFIGFMAGVLEVIPYFGAVAGAVPAVALGFMKSSTVGISLIVFFIAINQIEGHVVIPLVMGHHLEMRPLTILLSLIAGERLYGIVGMIIAVPVVSMARVLIPRVASQYHRLRARERGIRAAAESAPAQTIRHAESGGP